MDRLLIGRMVLHLENKKTRIQADLKVALEKGLQLSRLYRQDSLSSFK